MRLGFIAFLLVVSLAQAQTNTGASNLEDNSPFSHSITTYPEDEESSGGKYRWLSKPSAQRIEVAKKLLIDSIRVLYKVKTGVKFSVVVSHSGSGALYKESAVFEEEEDLEAAAWEIDYVDIALNIKLEKGSYFVYPKVTSGSLGYLPHFTHVNAAHETYKLFPGMYVNSKKDLEQKYVFSELDDQDTSKCIHYGPFFRWVLAGKEEFPQATLQKKQVSKKDTIGRKFKNEFLQLTTAINNNKNNKQAYNSRGNAYANVGQFENAIMDFSTAIDLDSLDVVSYTNRGLTYIKMGEYELAVEDLDKVISIDNSDPITYYIKALVYKRLGDLNKAITSFSKSIAYNPRDALTFYMRARTKVEQNDQVGALEDFEKTLLVDPNYWAAYKYRGELHLHNKTYEKAIQDFSKALQMNDKDTSVYFLRASCYETLKNDSLADLDFSSVISLNEEHIEGLYKRGITRSRLKNYSGAMDDFNKIIRLDPRHFNTYLQRGKLKLSMGDKSKACSDFSVARNKPSKELDRLIKNNCSSLSIKK